MRFKFSLLLIPEVSGDIIPISYQCQLMEKVDQMLTANADLYEQWLVANGLNQQNSNNIYCVSNLYIPKIRVEGDRLKIEAPRIQFWLSSLAEVGLRDFLESSFLDQTISIGDATSSVTFKIDAIDDISPVVYDRVMEYQSLSPIVVKGLRPNGSLEYLSPTNYVFQQFLVESLIERWENYYNTQYYGNRKFRFFLLSQPHRKSVTILNGTKHETKEIGYMIKFRLELDPMLQDFAYNLGIGDDIQYGFGYIEMLRKRK